ncbi:FMN-binding negative transcriptional regulator [Luteimonas sp. BDR2-5]|uniref:FMN-binding negative transcriptional regulator n=1 Tax=Proluteimonas luteida TaxID=2878685 RepID=UPI001E4400A3|nr:FMN-binding negative transcriptional regulator [Luteimonas sp. BDR2-5]MCD9027763.1 FMN-binding negative transcriptional regulator [Luteimonas sp. BDR2-5]
MGHARDSRYAPRDDGDVLRLVRAQPFAWLVSPDGDDAAFTPLPLRAECDADGRLVALRGHLARRNPHVARLRRDPLAHALFIGPHAYVSPSWLDDRTQAPSWNYAAAAFELQVECSEAEADIADELDALVTAMEAGRPDAWALPEMGERYARLARGVTALRGRITRTRATFKLGQDEAPHDFAQLLAGLVRGGEHDLAEWMRDFATERDA